MGAALAQRRRRHLSAARPQVLFTANGYIGECAAMNVFFLLESEYGGPPTLVTPALEDGTILPGVTRRSVLELASAPDGGAMARDGAALRVEERAIELAELREIGRAGRLLECFGTGTAVVCQPVETVVVPTTSGGSERFTCKHAYDGSSLAERLLARLQDIQYGRIPDHPWSMPICRLP